MARRFADAGTVPNLGDQNVIVYQDSGRAYFAFLVVQARGALFLMENPGFHGDAEKDLADAILVMRMVLDEVS